jgi:thiamine-monophosphate kinase
MISSVPPGRGEFELIAWARAKSAKGTRTRLGIGDDCAALALTPGRQTLVTTDMLMEGRHFRLSECSARDVGYKAMAVNLSDIAAMAGTPIAAFAAVALPQANASELFEHLFAGMDQLARCHGVDLAGGDTNAWNGPLVLSLTVIGEAEHPVTRGGALPGDAIFVTGPLGGSLLGRHLRPDPRLTEARALACLVPLHAMIDLSDGLSSDLQHILNESGNLGAALDAEAIPIHNDARTQSESSGRSPLDHALHDGEDFELCFTVSPADAQRLITAVPSDVHLWRIGEITDAPIMLLRDRNGARSTIVPRGFDHLRS